MTIVNILALKRAPTVSLLHLPFQIGKNVISFESITSETSKRQRKIFFTHSKDLLLMRKVVGMAHGMTGCVHHMSHT